MLTYTLWFRAVDGSVRRLSSFLAYEDAREARLERLRMFWRLLPAERRTFALRHSLFITEEMK